jgi:NADPH:quinone reductase-like Zn-dependent oxidoreductase
LLKVATVPKPQLKACCTGDTILVKVYAAGLNPADYKIMRGDFYWMKPFLTCRPGFDFAGCVVQAGPQCKRLKPGDMVHGMTSVFNTGTLAEFIVVRESQAATVPQHLTMVQAAASSLSSLTSYNCLAPYIIRNVSSVLVHGGGSSAGIAALQIASALHAKSITTTCSKRSAARAIQFGANRVIDYTEHDVWLEMAKQKLRFDIIYDTVSTETDSAWLRVIANNLLDANGVFVTITGDDSGVFGPCQLAQRLGKTALRKARAFCNQSKYVAHVQHQANAAQLEHINALKVVCCIDRDAHGNVLTHELTDQGVHNAFERLNSPDCCGKVVVVCRSLA